jgi:vacuolar protein sorting-associated protein 35
MHLIIGALQRMNVLGVENRDTLTHKATGVIVLAYPVITVSFPCRFFSKPFLSP